MWLAARRRYIILITIIIRITAGITILIILPCHFHLDLEITTIMAATIMEVAITVAALMAAAPIGAAPRRVAFVPVVLRWVVSVEAARLPVIIGKSFGLPSQPCRVPFTEGLRLRSSQD